MTAKALFVLVGALLLAACSPLGAPAAPISFMVWGDPAEKAAYEGIVAAFKAKQPNVEVTLTHIPGQNDYRRRLTADFAAGTPANVVLINYRRVGTFAARKAIEPLGPYLDRSGVVKEADFYPEAVGAFRFDGTLMCIPQNVSSLVVYYNKQLFDQAGMAYPAAGWSWDDFVQTALALTKDLDGDGRTDQYGAAMDPTTIRVAPFVWQNGGELIDSPTAPTQLTLQTPETLEAVQWFVDLQTRHHVVPDAEAAASEDGESRFQNGRAAMFFDSRRAVPSLREIKSFDWDVAALPQGKQAATILHSDAYCMSASTANKTAAWQFIEFANSAEGQTLIAKTGRTVPSLMQVSRSDAFLEPSAKPANSQVFLDAIPLIRAVPTASGWEDVESALDSEVERAFYGQASVGEAMTAAEQATARFFEQ